MNIELNTSINHETQDVANKFQTAKSFVANSAAFKEFLWTVRQQYLQRSVIAQRCVENNAASEYGSVASLLNKADAIEVLYEQLFGVRNGN